MKSKSIGFSAIVATLLCGGGWLSMPPAIAADVAFYPFESPPQIPGWWQHYYVEAGARAFLNNPQRDGVAALGGQSLAKYYEYRDLRPGPFLHGWASVGSNDGRYQFDAWAKNVGYNDQQYQFDASKAGEHYFGFSWDQVPHIYSTSAQTQYNGVGSTS